ncbi:MAG TPA: antibiotic biosynthesis monooxygenase [Myxococcota bacterium]|nr:antibiotic biosynthesis monooxygenase [Myxococcota bacterium]
MTTPLAIAESADHEPVTVVVTRRVRRGHEKAYEAWLERLVASTSHMHGFIGARLQRPRPGDSAFTSVFRFEGVDTLRAFEESELRRNALLEVAPLVEADALWSRLTGLELWFSPPPGTIVPQPSRLRMALLMVALVFGLVVSIGQLVGLVLGDAPAWLRLLVTITLEVFLMTYILMPRLTRWLARWIYPPARSTLRETRVTPAVD